MYNNDNLIGTDAWVITDRATLDNIIARGGKVILVSEDTPEYLRGAIQDSMIIRANCLLPDYNAVSSYIENDMYRFGLFYTDYLLSSEPDMYIVSILAAIINAIPIGILFGTEEIEMAASQIFFSFMEERYGVKFGIMNDPMNIPFIRKDYTPITLTKLYMADLLTFIEYTILFPADAPYPEAVYPKMIYDVRPVVDDSDPNGYVKYFEEFKRLVKTSGNKEIVDPLVRS